MHNGIKPITSCLPVSAMTNNMILIACNLSHAVLSIDPHYHEVAAVVLHPYMEINIRMRPRLPSFIYIVCYSELQGRTCRCSSCSLPCMAAVTAGMQAGSVYMLYTHGYIIGFPCLVGMTPDSAASL